MKTYRNAAFNGQRDYDCTNVCFAQGETAPQGNWVECDASEIGSTMQSLHVQGGIRFFGWL